MWQNKSLENIVNLRLALTANVGTTGSLGVLRPMAWRYKPAATIAMPLHLTLLPAFSSLNVTVY